MIDVLKEYLVSLGFSVDTSSLNQARRAMGSAEDSVNQFSSASLTGFAKAGVAVITFVAAANLAIAKFVGGLAKAELENEMFARRMWMNVDAARAYTSSLDALGVSLQDLYLSPELMRKYLELNSLSKSMAVPDYNEQMRGVRDITFEFQKLKLEGKYALQWIAYYLTKILAGPLAGFKKGLADTNELIQKNLPKWSEKAALVVSWFVRMGLAAWKIRYALGAVMAAFSAFKLVGVLSNPFGMMILGLTALLLLIDDFTTYQDGGESAFPKLWKWVEDLQGTMKDSGLDIDNFKEKIGDIIENVDNLSDELSKLLLLLGEKGGLSGLLSSAFLNTLTTFNDILATIAASIQIITAGLKGLRGEGWGDLGDGYESLKKALIPDDELRGKAEEWDKNAANKIREFISKYFIGDTFSNAVKNSQNYIYPKTSQPTVTKITMSPVYHINGATNPQGVATQISRSNTSLITRAVQGVNR